MVKLANIIAMDVTSSSSIVNIVKRRKRKSKNFDFAQPAKINRIDEMTQMRSASNAINSKKKKLHNFDIMQPKKFNHVEMVQKASPSSIGNIIKGRTRKLRNFDIKEPVKINLVNKTDAQISSSISIVNVVKGRTRKLRNFDSMEREQRSHTINATNESPTKPNKSYVRRKKQNVLFLGMTRVPLAEDIKKFSKAEQYLRHRVNTANCNLLRDTARIRALESLGYVVHAVSLVQESSWKKIGLPDDVFSSGGLFLNTNFTSTSSSSRGFITKLREKWPSVKFDYVFLDYYWLPDSVSWLKKGYLSNNCGILKNLSLLLANDILSENFQILLPMNNAFASVLRSHILELSQTFQIGFISGNVEELSKHHPAVKADGLIPEQVMSDVYGKIPSQQFSLLGIKASCADEAFELISGSKKRSRDLDDSNLNVYKFMKLSDCSM